MLRIDEYARIRTQQTLGKARAFAPQPISPRARREARALGDTRPPALHGRSGGRSDAGKAPPATASIAASRVPRLAAEAREPKRPAIRSPATMPHDLVGQKRATATQRRQRQREFRHTLCVGGAGVEQRNVASQQFFGRMARKGKADHTDHLKMRQFREHLSDNGTDPCPSIAATISARGPADSLTSSSETKRRLGSRLARAACRPPGCTIRTDESGPASCGKQESGHRGRLDPPAEAGFDEFGKKQRRCDRIDSVTGGDHRARQRGKPRVRPQRRRRSSACEAHGPCRPSRS